MGASMRPVQAERREINPGDALSFPFYARYCSSDAPDCSTARRTRTLYTADNCAHGSGRWVVEEGHGVAFQRQLHETGAGSAPEGGCGRPESLRRRLGSALSAVSWNADKSCCCAGRPRHHECSTVPWRYSSGVRMCLCTSGRVDSGATASSRSRPVGSGGRPTAVSTVGCRRRYSRK